MITDKEDERYYDFRNISEVVDQEADQDRTPLQVYITRFQDLTRIPDYYFVEEV